jgi:hypothetical protein
MVIENNHSTDFESPPPHMRFCISIAFSLRTSTRLALILLLLTCASVCAFALKVSRALIIENNHSTDFE